MSKKLPLYGLLTVMLLTPVALTVVNAQDKPLPERWVTAPENAFGEACGEIQADPADTKRHTKDSVNDDILKIAKYIDTSKKSLPSGDDIDLDMLIKNIDSMCSGLAALTQADREALSLPVNTMNYEFEELLRLMNESRQPEEIVYTRPRR